MSGGSNGSMGHEVFGCMDGFEVSFKNMSKILQEDWLGTKDVSYCSLGLLMSSSRLVPQELILVTAPKLQEDRGGTITGNVY